MNNALLTLAVAIGAAVWAYFEPNRGWSLYLAACSGWFLNTAIDEWWKGVQI